MNEKQIQKINAIKEMLKEIENLCIEHINDNPDLTEVHAFDLIIGAVEIYEDLFIDG